MKVILTSGLLLFGTYGIAQINISGSDIKNRVKAGIENKKGGTTSKEETETSTPVESTHEKTEPTTSVETPKKQLVKPYNNYDFKPGSAIIFADQFSTDLDGEFPTHWDLTAGQAVRNTIDSIPALCLTDGNYCYVAPLIKGNQYLTKEYTIEFDYYAPNGRSMGLRFLKNLEEQGSVEFDLRNAKIAGLVENGETKYLSGQSPKEVSESDLSSFHHIAIAVKGQTIKVYVDENRLCVMPNCGFEANSFTFYSAVSSEDFVAIANVKVCDGAPINPLNAIATDGKIVTYGIVFDVNKAIIKPESISTLKDLLAAINSNPTANFEIGGHTDNDGEDASNLLLSQKRADAVKSWLVENGISASRLTTKGYGESKPITDNNTIENRAKNRRVEIIKI